MNSTTILAGAGLASVVANALHWRGRSDERFLYHPQSGWPRKLFIFWILANGIMAILLLADFVPAPAFLAVLFGFTIGHELYSIAHRQQQRCSNMTTPPNKVGPANEIQPIPIETDQTSPAAGSRR